MRVCQVTSVMSNSVWLTLWTVARQAPLSMGILQTRILKWVAMPSSRGIFPTQGSNPGLPHCWWSLYCLNHQGSPRIPEWVAYPFSRGTSWPRNHTGVSCIAGGFFTNWAIRETPLYKTGMILCTAFQKERTFLLGHSHSKIALFWLCVVYCEMFANYFLPHRNTKSWTKRTWHSQS